MIIWWVKFGVVIVLVSPFQALGSSQLVWTKESILSSYMLPGGVDMSLIFCSHDFHTEDGNCTVCWNIGRTSAFIAPQIWKLILYTRHLLQKHTDKIYGKSVNSMLYMHIQFSWVKAASQRLAGQWPFLNQCVFPVKKRGHNQFIVYNDNINSFKCIKRVWYSYPISR